MTPEQRQSIGMNCICCDKPISGIAPQKPRCCKQCHSDHFDHCVECDGLGLTYCGFCNDGLYDGKPCLMCRGESVVDCFCVPDTDDQCKPLYVPFNS